ncbi:MAG: hypothetical protein ACRCZ1_04515, partial [Cetobacterium sp.]
MLFNTSMKLSGVTFDNLGIADKGDGLFNYQALSDMAKKDLPTALNVLSQMYTKGQLNTQTMQKMFTARHFMEISNLLLDINGNTSEFINRIAKGVAYTDDFAKKMFDINEQMKLFSNNTKSSFGGLFKLFGDGATGALMAVNDSMNLTNRGIVQLGVGFSSLMATFATASISAGLFMKTIVPLLKTAGVFAAGGYITAAISLIALMGSTYAEVRKQTVDLNLNLNKNLLLDKQIASEIKSRLDKEMLINKTVKETMTVQGSSLSTIEDSSTIVGQLLTKYQDLKNLLDATSQIKTIDSSFLFTQTNDTSNKLKTLEFEFDNLVKAQENTMGKFYAKLDLYSTGAQKQIMKSKYSTSYSAANMVNINMEEMLAPKIAITDKIKEVLGAVSKEGGSIKDVKDELLKHGIQENDLVKMLGLGSVRELNKALARFIKEKDAILTGFKEAKAEVDEVYKSLNDQIIANGKAENMSIAWINKLKMSAFERDKEYGGKSGTAGLFEMFKSGDQEYLRTAIKNTEDLVKAKKDEIATRQQILDMSDPKEIKEEDRTQLENSKRDLIELEERHLSLADSKVALDKSSPTALISKYKDIDLNGTTIEQLFTIYKLKLDIARIESSDPNNNQIRLNQEIINQLEADLAWKMANPTGSSSSSGGKRKTGDSNYEMKYNNYIKENLNLELEIAKVMMTQ